MDIEGHEIEVFDSLIKFSKEYKNHLPFKIIFEVHFPIYKKEYVKEIFNQIFETGYKIKYLSSTNEPKKVFKEKGYFHSRL